MTKHLKYGGSTAHRTLACPGWAKASAGIPNKAGAAARHGSMHHTVQEKCRDHDMRPDDLIGMEYRDDQTGEVLIFTDEELQTAEVAYQMTDTVLDKYDIDLMMVEPFVQYEPDLIGGSIDLLGLSKDRKTILVLDYKFGAKIISAKESAQGLLYAASSRKDFKTRNLWLDAEKIVVAIIQPWQGKPDVWECDVARLDEFVVEFVDAVTIAEGENPFISPGKHCEFCPAAPYCDASRDYVKQATLIDPDSHNALAAAAGMLETVEVWVKAVKTELHSQLSRGVNVDGWKLVEKRATRVWSDFDGFAKAYEVLTTDSEALYKKEPLSPAQAEKVVKKNKVNIDLDSFVERVSPGTTIAPASDKREPVKVTGIPDNLMAIVSKEKG